METKPYMFEEFARTTQQFGFFGVENRQYLENDRRQLRSGFCIKINTDCFTSDAKIGSKQILVLKFDFILPGTLTQL